MLSSPLFRQFPGELQKILEWFRDYKIPDGKPANKFGYNNTFQSKVFTMEVRLDPSHTCLILAL